MPFFFVKILQGSKLFKIDKVVFSLICNDYLMFLRFLLQSRLYSTIYDAHSEIVYSWDRHDTTAQGNFEKKRRPENWPIRRFSLNPRYLTFGILILFLNIFQKQMQSSSLLFICEVFAHSEFVIFFCSLCADPDSQS